MRNPFRKNHRSSTARFAGILLNSLAGMVKNRCAGVFEGAKTGVRMTGILHGTKDHSDRSFLPGSFLPVLLVASLLLTQTSCHQGKPDLSSVEVPPVHIERFDTAFFHIDSNDIVPGLHRVAQEYPWFTGDFVVNILGVGPLSDTSRTAFFSIRQFLTSYMPIKDSLELKYKQLGWLEKDLGDAFKYCKYYFPKYSLPEKVVAFIGPFDGPGVALTPHALAIGLQSYAGRNFSFYISEKGQEAYPMYISRRFEPEYITANCTMSLEQDLFPDSSDGRPLIEQMITKGKYCWLQRKILPDAPDSITTGFTASQLKWCKDNEGQIWTYFLQNADLYSVDPDIIKNYIGDSPKTMGMPDTAPGNIGTWVGWKIVENYVAKSGSADPLTVMHASAKKIFEESKYKPK